ncbi:sigma-70 family RNA polymerase sigma factor [Candidatus Parcubacteria bacterium]|nr:sigma-70 family RNA polymerase sigma factor [Candidatus Parcubacteria bacterium]
MDKCGNKTDEELVTLTLADQDYFLYIINRYKDKLFRYIRRITNVDPEETEDILQEVFIKAYTNLNDFDQALKFSSWIYRIAHNQVITYYRKTKARPHGHSASLSDEEVKNLASDLNPAKDVDIQLLKSNIQKTLGRLEEKHREVLVLKFIEEKSYQEISDILRRPMGTVASLINRAKQEFKKASK